MKSDCKAHAAIDAFPVSYWSMLHRVLLHSSVIDLFSVSSCIATSRLVHRGGYIQKL